MDGQPVPSRPPEPAGPPTVSASGSEPASGELAGMVRAMRQEMGAMRQEFAAGLATGHGLARTVEKIGRDIEAVARGNFELRKENEELKRLQAEGFFKFALRVDGEDFRAFAVIMALGNRHAAAEFLEVPPRSFYDRVEQWPGRGGEYRRMWRLIEWRKNTARKIKLHLGDSLLSGEAGEAGENPETLKAVAEQLKANAVDSRSYPEIFRQVLEALQSQNAANWRSVRDELVEIVTEEIPQ